MKFETLLININKLEEFVELLKTSKMKEASNGQIGAPAKSQNTERINLKTSKKGPSCEISKFQKKSKFQKTVRVGLFATVQSLNSFKQPKRYILDLPQAIIKPVKISTKK